MRDNTTGPVSDHDLGLWGRCDFRSRTDAVDRRNPLLPAAVGALHAAVLESTLTVLRECSTASQAHDFSVDIWAVGVLAMQLFLGYEEFPAFESMIFDSQGVIDSYVNLIFTTVSRHKEISEAGKNFIRSCLAYDGQKRPTACAAFHHAWLQEPKADNRRFKMLEADNLLSWKPQRVKFPVIEDLTAGPSENCQGGSAPAKRWDVATVSPHFMDQSRGWTNGELGRQDELELPDILSRPDLNPDLGLKKRRAVLGGTENAKRMMVSLFKSQ